MAKLDKVTLCVCVSEFKTCGDMLKLSSGSSIFLSWSGDLLRRDSGSCWQYVGILAAGSRPVLYS